jgi:N-methylhydantoinase A/oxoprolinase/acetone carboxylase beta subunit
VSALRIGIDVGGTNTDAVLLGAAGVLLARTKTPTTEDPIDGIAKALGEVVGTHANEISTVSLGTTHALNAILRRRELGRVAVLRLAGPATQSVQPFAGWPADLRAAVDGGSWIVRGGVEIDGRVHPLDVAEVRGVLAQCAGVDGIAIAGSFSLQDPVQELEAAALVREVLGPEMPISLGHQVGGIGLLERENAAILNASLGGIVGGVIDAFVAALATHGIVGTPYLTQNDGTLMSVEQARALPVLTIGGGASNSIRGAGVLTGLTDALVIDVGGTSTDVGALAQGFPRESAFGVELGGVQTNFRMPDVVSVALGGGTIIGPAGELGPESVGYRLLEQARVFGGGVLTMSDCAVAAGRAAMGDAGLLGDAAWPEVLASADLLVADAIDRMKLSRGDVPVILVGGGSAILPATLPGASELLRPSDFDVANAIGAAVGLVSGDAEHVLNLGLDREAGIEAVRSDAAARALRAGADPALLETIRIDEVSLAYTDPPMSRLRVKVAGPPLA